MIPSGENERIVENTVDDDSHRSVASLENGSPGGDKEILQSKRKQHLKAIYFIMTSCCHLQVSLRKWKQQEIIFETI